MFHHLDVLCVNFKLKNREAIDAKLQHLHRIETQCTEAERSLQKLMGRLPNFGKYNQVLLKARWKSAKQNLVRS